MTNDDGIDDTAQTVDPAPSDEGAVERSETEGETTPRMVRLGDVAAIRRQVIDPTSLDAETAYLGLEDIERGGRILRYRTVGESGLTSSKFVFRDSDLLYGKLRPNLGKIARPSRGGVCSTDILPISVGGDLNKDYLGYYLSQSKMIEFAASRTSGANLPRISPKALLQIPVPLPSLEKQRRIVAVLDRADAIRTKHRQVLAAYDELPRSLFAEMFGRSECGYKKVPLSTFADFYSGGTPSKKENRYWSGNLPWFSAKDLKHFDLYDSIDHIAEDAIAETTLRLLPANTIVLVVRGMILAHDVPVGVLRNPSAINQDLKALIPKRDFDVDFLAYAIRSQERWMLSETGTASHGTKKIETGVLGRTPIPEVPLALQREFARRVEAIETARRKVERALALDDELFASLQSLAFRGEL